ncbi:MAG: NUDIX hydrolase [Ruminococcaceae bacterium]|nr:NUDIX hydrolase [Oscillospiraceae bacterium]
MSNLEEKRISRKEIYKGHIIDVVLDTVTLPNGKCAPREVCMHVGAVCVIPLLDDGRVLMERQFRYPHGRVFLEIPAGKLNSKDEDSLLAAQRELREETGAVAKKYTDLGDLIPSPAVLDEKIRMYLAEDISFTDRELDDDEFLDVEKIPLAELYEMVMRGEIADAKTQVAILKVWDMRGKNYVLD